MGTTDSGFTESGLDQQTDDTGRERRRRRKKRIAMLGAGPASLACAWQLTSSPQLRNRYDITIYTMGWKIGGKGASGRGEHDRIEEHGLHILFGGYHTFFRAMRECYAELNRPPDHPLATWRDAFKPHNFGVVEDYIDKRWYPWPLVFPYNTAIPGDPGVEISAEDYLGMAFQGLVGLVFGWQGAVESSRLVRPASRADVRPAAAERAALDLIGALLRVAQRAVIDVDHRAPELTRLVQRLRQLAWPALRALSHLSVDAHRFWLGVDFVASLVSGLVLDRVLEPGGFEKINEYDFREWLEQHGAHPLALEGPWGRTIYDAAFSYEDGDPNKQRIAAGVGLHLLLGCGMYRGSMYFKMQAGMGDTVFAPLYQVLKNRGVKFEFFHRVDGLHLGNDRRHVNRITLTRQASLKEGRNEYEPLIRVNGLECWPAEPRYGQLKDAKALRKVNLESYYEKSPVGVKRELTHGRDFDEVVFGIPIGAVPFIAGELVRADRRWAEMADRVTAVQTIGLQLWMAKDLRGLGWNMPRPLLSLFQQPLNTWCDMSQLLEAENWPEDLMPKSIQYFTGAQAGPGHAPHPLEDPNFEKRQTRAAMKSAEDYLEHALEPIWPRALKKDRFRWRLLVDEADERGANRLESQYVRSNCGPSERCTLALPGTIKHRMSAGDTGFTNLKITGDWIDNGIYAACMEGAFNAGVLTARAISGIPFEIDGVWNGGTTGPLHPSAGVPKRTFKR